MKTCLAIACLCVVLVLAGCSSGSSMTSLASNHLISSLTIAIPGLDATKAIGGAGSLLGVASKGMTKDDFSALSMEIPETDDLIKEAANLGGTGEIDSLAEAKRVMSKIGVTPGQATQLTAAMSAYIAELGGKVLADKFVASLK